MLSLKEKKTITYPALNLARHNHEMIKAGNYYFVLGGQNDKIEWLDSVEYFDQK